MQKFIALVELVFSFSMQGRSLERRGVQVESPAMVVMRGKITKGKANEAAFTIIRFQRNDGVWMQDTSDQFGNYQLPVFADTVYSFQFRNPYPQTGIGTYFEFNATFKIPFSDFRKDISLYAISNCYGFPELHFKPGSTTIDRDYVVARDTNGNNLDYVVAVLKSNPTMEIRLCANSGVYESANLSLSEQRAKAVNDYLVSQGIEQGRLTCRGFGRTKLLRTKTQIKNEVPPAQRVEMDGRNRRVTFQIVSTKYHVPK